MVGEHRRAQHGLAALPWAAHTALAPRHRGARGDPRSSARGQRHPAPCPTGMGRGVPRAGASRCHCPPSRPHPGRVCLPNGGSLSAPLCRRMRGIAAASEVPATAHTRAGQQDMGLGTRASGQATARGAGWFLTLLCLRVHSAAQEPIPSPPSPGQCPNPVPVPVPLPGKAAGSSPRWLMWAPTAAPPDGGLAAFQRRLCCIIYQQEITDKRLRKEGAVPQLWGAWCCQDSSLGAHAPPWPRCRSPLWFGGAPRQGQRWSHSVPCLPCAETPGTTARPEQGELGSVFEELPTPGTHGLPSTGEGQEAWRGTGQGRAAPTDTGAAPGAGSEESLFNPR